MRLFCLGCTMLLAWLILMNGCVAGDRTIFAVTMCTDNNHTWTDEIIVFRDSVDCKKYIAIFNKQSSYCNAACYFVDRRR